MGSWCMRDKHFSDCSGPNAKSERVLVSVYLITSAMKKSEDTTLYRIATFQKQVANLISAGILTSGPQTHIQFSTVYPFDGLAMVTPGITDMSENSNSIVLAEIDFTVVQPCTIPNTQSCCV